MSMRATVHALLALVALGFLASPPEAHAVSFTVDSTADTPDANPGDGICADASGACTLRATSNEAQALAAGPTPPCVVLPFELNVDIAVTGTITLAGALDFTLGACGMNLAITGPGADLLAVRGGGFVVGFASQSFASSVITGLTVSDAPFGFQTFGNFDYGTSLGLTDVTIRRTQRGVEMLGASGTSLLRTTIEDNDYGIAYGEAAIVPDTAVIAVDSTIANNRFDGMTLAALFVTITRSVIRGNGGFGLDADRFAAASPVVQVTDSVIDGNGAAGVLDSRGPVQVVRSTISRNGGSGIVTGAFADSPARVVNSTISGNRSPGDGGGILVEGGNVLVASSTITGNVADADANGTGDGGGIFIRPGATSSVTIRNSILSGDLDHGGEAPECVGGLASLGYNLLGDVTGCPVSGDPTGNVSATDPGLGVLQNNGGPTETHALLIGSPAIDAGDPTGCRDEVGALLATDQRGFPRPQGAACDVGAFEQTAPDAALAMCHEDLSECRADLIPDGDGDGEVDTTDRCPETPPGEAVDDAGCSRAQFCAGFEVTTREGKRACRRADWRNDEPLLLRSDDCAVDKGGSGTDDDRCVPSD
jgi:trimeric autotransporter adhesin